MASRQKKSGQGGATQRSGPSSPPEATPAAATDPAPVGARPVDAGPTRHEEIETKLEVDGTAALPELTGRRSLAAVGLVAAAPPVVHELDAVYFDTAEFDLLRSKLTLRHRTGGDDAGWHLKLPASSGARTEIGVPLEPGSHDPLTAKVPAALADHVLGAARGRDLRPVARIRNRRTVRRLLDPDGSAMVEVADDQVTATRLLAASDADGGGGLTESTPNCWREVEVEILAGDRNQLAAVVGLLETAGARPASSVSKLARALDDGDRAPVRKSKNAGPAVVIALGKLRDSMIAADRALREGTEVGLHDARAAAQRTRSVLAVYARLFTSGATRHLRGELRRLGSVLGTARDLEVLQRRLEVQLIEEPAEYASVAAARIDAEFATVLPVAMADVAQTIRSEPYLLMLRELDDFIATPPFSRRAAKPATAELPTELATAWRDLGVLVDQALADPSDNNIFHDVRKAAKALRYAAEAASATLGENTVVFAAAIEEIQEVLGEHQDALAAAAWLADLALRPDTDGVSGFVFGRLHAFEQAAAHGTLDDFSDAWDRVEDGELLEAAFSR